MIVNIPHEKSKEHLVWRVSVEGQQIAVSYFNNSKPLEEYKPTTKVCSLFVSDHMFEPKNQEHLRRMIGEEIIRAIEAGRKVGYMQAQADIRAALGVPR